MNGQEAERYVAKEFDLERFEPNWCDLVNPRTGTKYEVKTAEKDRKFRLWADQHRSLLSSNTNGTAWYAFVVGREITRRKPETVTAVVNGQGGWNSAGHKGRPGKKQKKVDVDLLR